MKGNIQKLEHKPGALDRALALVSSREIISRSLVLASGREDEFLSLRRQTGASRQRGGANEKYIQELEQEADELDKFLTQASAPYRELKDDLAIGWEKVRDSLQPGEAAIEFVSFNLFAKWTGKINYAALILRSGMKTPAYVHLCEETDLAEIFKKLDGKKPEEQAQILYEEDGLELYARVWQPLEKFLEETGVKTVYYSPSGLLHKLSFNSIPEKKGALLSSVYDLKLVSSTREIARRKNKTPEKPSSAALYGGLQYDIDADKIKQEPQPNKNQGTHISSMPPDDIPRGDSWEYLKESYDECWFIQRQLEKNNIDVALYDYEKGNKESFKNLNGKRTGIIHLATHGFFWDEKNHEEMERLERLVGGKEVLKNPLMRSYLLLSGANNAWDNKAAEGVGNGILFADDIANINLAGTRLVVLSACETGLGVVDNKEGVFGLQRAFKLAGAQTIVMSLWKVDDYATKEYMKKFYEIWLSNGMDKQKAFKEAQRWLRETKEYSSPYYWAAFVMMD